MKVRLLSSRCGQYPSGMMFGQSVGDIIEIEDEAEAKRMIQSGLAVKFDGVDTAMLNNQRGAQGRATREAVQ